jgi:hypothetical protein
MTTAQILDLTPTDGNLYHNAPNQIRRTIGRYTDIFVGPRMGTVRDSGAAAGTGGRPRSGCRAASSW